ncbi:MAG: WbqC family protein [Lachnospiraceae bacterium]|nr:WbqC family protein [Lachnospiraceae bacterium]
MRLGIMQPYFFPYLGYFSLIKHVDKFILFDTAQFIRHGWIERNRILKREGWQYISVSLMKHSQKTPINAIQINNGIDWKQKIFSKLIYYKKAPYFKAVMQIIQEIFEYNYADIVSLDKQVLEKVCTYLNINTNIEIFSKMNLKIEKVNAPDEWALNICKAIEGADEYWNPQGGTKFFDIIKYQKANINIKFQKINLKPYKQANDVFEEGLSIIDIMMYNSPTEINKMLDDFDLL